MPVLQTNSRTCNAVSFKTEFLKWVSDTPKVNPDLDSMKVRHWKLDSLEHGLKGTSGSLALWQNCDVIKSCVFLLPNEKNSVFQT